MRQIIALIFVSVLAFAAIIFIKDYRLGNFDSKEPAASETAAAPEAPQPVAPEKPAEKAPELKDIEAPLEEPDTIITAIAPKELIGTFAIDKPATQKWLQENDYGTEFDAEALVSIWPLLLIEFDGKVFNIDNGEKSIKQRFIPTSQEKDKLTIPLNLTGASKATSYTLIWDEKGFWACYPVPKPGTDETFTAQVRFNKVSE